MLFADLFVAVVLTGCHGPACPVEWVAKTVEKTKTVIVQREVDPVRRVVQRVRHRHILRRR